MSDTATAIMWTGVTFFSTGLGGLAALHYREHLHLLLGFSGGAVLGVAFFDLLPETFALAGGQRLVVIAIALGFLVFFGLERVMPRHHAHAGVADRCDQHVGVVGAAGLSLHSFLDGVAIGVAFQADATIGSLVAFGVIAHDLNDGLNTVTVVLAHGNSLRRSVAWLLVDMSAPMLGAVSATFFAVSPRVLPWLLAFFAGVFVYIGAADLLAEAREHRSPLVGMATVVGMTAVFVITWSLRR